MQMYYFRNAGPRIPPPQQNSRHGDSSGDPTADLLNPDGALRSNKKRKLQDNIATSYVALPMNAPTGLVATARSEFCHTCYTNLLKQWNPAMADYKRPVSLDACSGPNV